MVIFYYLNNIHFSATLIGYGLASGFPFSSWGESFFMAIQTMVIAFLICDFTGRRGLGIILNLFYAGFVYVLVSGMVTVEQLQVLQLCNLPVTVISRLIQVSMIPYHTNVHAVLMLVVRSWQTSETDTVELFPRLLAACCSLAALLECSLLSRKPATWS